uniref:C-type lectin domain-containing protein n=1 Tax=Rhabditophanes sp. KR3021 TaxID=114890 RepID=A0AC35TL23_9BILA
MILLQVAFIWFHLFYVDGVICPAPWTYFDDSCWLISKNVLSYNDAKNECRDRYGGFLTKVENEKQDSILTYLLEKNSQVKDVKKHRDETSRPLKDCFKKVKGKNAEIAFSNQPGAAVIFTDIKDLKSCLLECEHLRSDFNFNCLSVLWYKETHDCLLNSEKGSGSARATFSIQGIPFNISYYEYQCEEQAELLMKDDPQLDRSNAIKGIISNEIPGVRTCFGKHKHSMLKGFADKIIHSFNERECLSECWKCTDCLPGKGMCKAVNFYKDAGECVMAGVSIKTNADKFNTDETLSDFFDRRRECALENCEEKEILVSFVLDGSESIGADAFNKSIKFVDDTITTIHEISEFWTVIIFQFGTTNYIELNSAQFDNLNQFRTFLAGIGWRRERDSNIVVSIEDAMNVITKQVNKRQYDEVITFIVSDGIGNVSVVEEIPRFVVEFPSVYVYTVALTEAINFNVLSRIGGVNKTYTSNNYTNINSNLQKTLCSFNGNIKKITQKDTQPFSLFSFNNDEPLESLDENEVWLGLQRNDFGELKWIDQTQMNTYATSIVHLLEVEGEDGDCIFRKGIGKWQLTENCSFKKRFVCSFKPTLSIEEKFKRDYWIRADNVTTEPLLLLNSSIVLPPSGTEIIGENMEAGPIINFESTTNKFDVDFIPDKIDVDDKLISEIIRQEKEKNEAKSVDNKITDL